MKLSEKERKAINMLRQLQLGQRDELLAQMERTVIANRVSIRVGKLRRLKLTPNKKVMRHYGLPVTAGANRKGWGGGETV